LSVEKTQSALGFYPAPFGDKKQPFRKGRQRLLEGKRPPRKKRERYVQEKARLGFK